MKEKKVMEQASPKSKYQITLFVTYEEEVAIMNLFSANRWPFIKVSDHELPQTQTVVKDTVDVTTNTPNTTEVSTDISTEMVPEMGLVAQNLDTEVLKDPIIQNEQVNNSDKDNSPCEMSVVDNENMTAHLSVTSNELTTSISQMENESNEYEYFQISPYVLSTFAGNTEILSITKSLLYELSNVLKDLNTPNQNTPTDLKKLNVEFSQLKKAAQLCTVGIKRKNENENQVKKVRKKRCLNGQLDKRTTRQRVKTTTQMKNSTDLIIEAENSNEEQENPKDEGVKTIDESLALTSSSIVYIDKDTEEEKDVSVEKNTKGKSKPRAKMYREGDAVRNEIDKRIDVMSLMVMKNDEISCCMCQTKFENEDLFKTHGSQCLAKLFNKSGRGVYKCTDCRAFYRQAYTLLRHKRSGVCVPGQERKDENFLTCDTCGKTYPTRRTTEYVHHVQAHNNERPFVCEFCGKDFVRWTTLRNHKRIHTGEKPYTCRYCPLTFISDAGQRNHEMVRHTDLPRSFVCDKCGASFKFHSRLTYHIKSVHDKTTIYCCDLCDKIFTRKGSLTDHKKIHKKIKDKICDTCGKGFMRQTDLEGHMKRHRNERSFFCDECGKGFYKPINLEEHKRSHSGVKPFICNLCKYECAYYSNAVKHCRARHPEVTVLKEVIERKPLNVSLSS